MDADNDKTDKLKYIEASLKLSNASTLELSIDGMGTKRPYYSLYKLHHYISVSMGYDKNSYKLSENQNSLKKDESGNNIVVSDKYEEVSNYPIESDPGPDLEAFAEKLKTIEKAVEEK